MAVDLPDHPSGGRIAFRSDRDGNGEIYVAGCDGSSPTNVTNHSADDKQPSWAEGGLLAFSSDSNTAGGFDVYLLTLDPWGVQRLTTNQANDEAPALSPDGSKVAFVSHRDGNAEIYVLTVSDGSLTRLTDNSSSDSDPSWSPDGDHLVFASDRDGDWDVFIADADGTNVSNLTDSSADDSNGHDDRWPDFGYYDYGDGTGEEVIAFASDRDGDWEIFTMYSDGSDLAQSTSDVNGAVDAEPSWDSLGEYLVVHSNRDTYYEIATMYYDASEFTNISRSSASGDTSPDWEPVSDPNYCGE